MTSSQTGAALGAPRETALITGASSGIGEAFARALAARGMNLVLIARSAARLDALAGELARAHGIVATPIAADLADTNAPDAIVIDLQRHRIAVDMLVNNAGYGTHGEFIGLDAQRERAEVVVNAYAPVALTRALLPGMIERRRGAVINVASTAAFQPVPYMATYGATKAFVLSFSEALAEEVRRYGVRVLTLCPGQTETAFFTGMDEARIGRPRTPDQVVRTALRALERGKSVVVDGFANAALANAPRLAPRRLVARVAALVERPAELRRRRP